MAANRKKHTEKEMDSNWLPRSKAKANETTLWYSHGDLWFLVVLWQALIIVPVFSDDRFGWMWKGRRVLLEIGSAL